MYSLSDVIEDIRDFENADMFIEDIALEDYVPKNLLNDIPQAKFGCAKLYSDCFDKGLFIKADSPYEFTYRVSDYLQEHLMVIPGFFEHPIENTISLYVVNPNGKSELIMQRDKIEFPLGKGELDTLMLLSKYAYVVHSDLSVNLLYRNSQ